MQPNKSVLLASIFLLCFHAHLSAQSLSAKVVDSVNGKPIAFATIQLNKKGIITNEEGRFTFLLDGTTKETDTLFISCMGYMSLSKPINQFTEAVIELAPKAIELKEVIVSNKNYTAEEIIDFVAENLSKNYTHTVTKQSLFYRASSFNRWNKSDFKVKKSSIAVLNQRFLDSILNSIPKNSSYYSEIAGDFYANHSAETYKLKLLKASKLYDKSLEFDQELIEKKFNDILRKNVKKGSYFKIKSGLFGAKVDEEEVNTLFEEETDSTEVAQVNAALEEKKKKKEEEQKNYAGSKRYSLVDIFKRLPTAENTDLNFITKSKKYDYTLQAFTYLGTDAVYVIDFKPSGSADYKGTLYINADDFALLQVDYENVKSLKKLNLLGVSLNKYRATGKIIYSKGSNGLYSLRYCEMENAARVGVKRPLKIIEKNKVVKGRNKQNELSGKIDFVFNTIEKDELVIFETEAIDQTNFDAYKENNEVLPTYMPNYDPEFWKGYTIIEPNAAIKDFTSIKVDED